VRSFVIIRCPETNRPPDRLALESYRLLNAVSLPGENLTGDGGTVNQLVDTADAPTAAQRHIASTSRPPWQKSPVALGDIVAS
jgi:hypothetical protein